MVKPMRHSLVFPAPFDPNNPKQSLRRTWKLTWLTAVIGFSLWIGMSIRWQLRKLQCNYPLAPGNFLVSCLTMRGLSRGILSRNTFSASRSTSSSREDPSCMNYIRLTLIIILSWHVTHMQFIFFDQQRRLFVVVQVYADFLLLATTPQKRKVEWFRSAEIFWQHLIEVANGINSKNEYYSSTKQWSSDTYIASNSSAVEMATIQPINIHEFDSAAAALPSMVGFDMACALITIADLC